MKTLLRLRQKFTRLLLIGGLGLTAISMNGCDGMYGNDVESLNRVKAKGEIVVLTTKSPLIYSQLRHDREAFGIDHDLIQAFAERYNIKTRFVVLPNEDAVLQALSKGEGDLAAARLRTPRHSSGFLTSPAYEETYLSLYCHRKSQVLHIRDLKNKKVSLLSKDNYQGLSERLRQFSPGVQVDVKKDIKTETLIAGVSQRKSDCAIAENFSGDFYSRYHGQIEKVSALTEPYSLSWLLRPDNQDLLRLLRSWYQQAYRDDEIMRTLDRYKTYLVQLDKNDIAQFFKRTQTILPSYKQHFRRAAAEYDLPWQLVASVAYQESHWNPEARSFTGVRGLMQLTSETAEHLGVDDRTDPVQSIQGGSKYIRILLDRMPEDLNSKDRLALALAAYNVGLAHLKDAQKLAEKMGRNPYSWHHLKEVLPLLADPDYADELEYGPARGYETVDFVERVKSFYNLMTSAR